ncbi:ribonuclease T [Ochrobactrum pecoris]|uniref:Ribonuclease T n=1 Tax=Brucella pecoris TaxID=867683 RepID=A0A5C5CUG1_9HYPH|nr:ribonuclease T [Brucella pecoris]MBB4092911.1 ribonuclease T2 [Brucella pecoris]NKW80718.1 ribonuclease T [Brucella pecoris]TNV14714.1 ribonuclease T [Brucella pecoris]
MLRRFGAAAIMLFAATIASVLAVAPGRADDVPGEFDFYVLALSWSPSYCASEGPRANKQQCGTDRPFGFVVHGLWPQNEWGYPANCQLDNVRSRGGYVPRQIISSLSDIMPAAGLVAYQWRKHGSCSGLSQDKYFSTLRNAFDQVSVPPSLRNLASRRRVDPLLVEKAFIAANPGMKPDGISVSCKRNYLQEVRICMTKDLQYRACGQVDANACRSRSVMMPATQ